MERLWMDWFSKAWLRDLSWCVNVEAYTLPCLISAAVCDATQREPPAERYIRPRHRGHLGSRFPWRLAASKHGGANGRRKHLTQIPKDFCVFACFSIIYKFGYFTNIGKTFFMSCYIYTLKVDAFIQKLERSTTDTEIFKNMLRSLHQ